MSDEWIYENLFLVRVGLVFVLVLVCFVAPLMVMENVAKGESWMGLRRWVADLLFNPESYFPVMLAAYMAGILSTAAFLYFWTWTAPPEQDVVINVTGEDLAAWDRKSKTLDQIRDVEKKRRTPKGIRYELRG